ncbi:acyl-CoA dehydrogenase family protein [Marinobacter sp. X15-166B]|uniref:acyl-CoA dehydrogenase family protein n=1 Tax=Marinobacter sp. X15-166B TaxID=1897620 RepID=UPI00085CADF1|nr:acyl-CoA dehydrogenase family protein [Marinobacter sp. X15-166B]OEY66324.1 acyl-CoA dehydrogenase [Marinobacter sp. X15-166B]
MEFRLTDEQYMVRDTAQAFLADASSSGQVRRAMTAARSYDPAVWQRLCTELYVQAVTIPEAYGGLGLGYVDLAIVLEQMGRKLFCSPFMATVGMATNALLLVASDEQKQRWLPAIAEGTQTATLAWTGPQAARAGGSWGAEAVSATWTATAEGYQLDGDLRYVIDGDTADLLIVAARTPGSSGSEGIGLFVVPASSAGVERQWTPTLDQSRRLANLTLRGVSVAADQCLGVAGEGWPQLQKILALAKVSLAAEQLGVASEALDMAVNYTLEREQFGRAIASYQAVKHKAADMKLKAEVACSAVYYAACVASEVLAPDGDVNIAAELDEAAAMAKGYCSDTVFFNAGSALQLFGGVGFTAEYDIQLYFKRAKASELYLGNGAAQREQIAAMLLDGESAQ